MATEYKQSNIAGTSYERTYKIEIDYPDDGIPVAIMRREKIFVLSDGSKLHQPMVDLPVAFDPSKQYALLNPETGEALGASVTLLDIFVAFYSIFVNESDAAAQRLAEIEVLTIWAQQFPEGVRSIAIQNALINWPEGVDRP